MRVNRWIVFAAMAMAVSLASLSAQQRLPSPTLTPLYTFQGEADGATPYAGVILDEAGNLYGTASQGGIPFNLGTAFQIDTRQRLTVLHSFSGLSDGYYPYGGLMRDSTGKLYGAATLGGTNNDGTVYRLNALPTFCQRVLCPWNVNSLYNFSGVLGMDGAQPASTLIRDTQGNLYGTTNIGGNGSNCGTVFQVDSQEDETVLYTFNGPDGCSPFYSALIRDAAGNFYGTTRGGGTSNTGVVFKLDSSGNETVLHSFVGGSDGVAPYAGVIADTAGNLYGTTSLGGANNQGIVFELTPGPDGTWDETVLWNFGGSGDGALPYAGLLLDSHGNLYGTTLGGGNHLGICGVYGCGVIFELTPNGSNWTETVLYTFTGAGDGNNPSGTLVSDTQGNIYGTTQYGGDLDALNPACVGVGCGVVFRLAR